MSYQTVVSSWAIFFEPDDLEIDFPIRTMSYELAKSLKMPTDESTVFSVLQ
jgi:hypothetical protein